MAAPGWVRFAIDSAQPRGHALDVDAVDLAAERAAEPAIVARGPALAEVDLVVTAATAEQLEDGLFRYNEKVTRDFEGRNIAGFAPQTVACAATRRRRLPVLGRTLG